MRLGETRKISTSSLTETTLRNMIKIVNEQKTDPLVRRTVENILQSIPEKEWDSEIQAVFNFVKSRIRYTRDVNGIEYIKTPVRHLIELRDVGISYGDCDDMSLLLATLLESAGYRTRFVIIRSEGNPYDSYNHIYTEVLHPVTKEWIALDATMKAKPYKWRPVFLKKKVYAI